MEPFDLAFVGHYTRDTIVYPGNVRTVDGGAFYYGANVAARMGQRVAVVTRLAQEHWHVVAELASIGVTVFATPTPASTCLRLEYPTADLDERTLSLTSSAGPFTVDELPGIRARAWHVGASVRGEVPAPFVAALAARGGIISLDVQGFVRVMRGGRLTHDDWPDRAAILKHLTLLKADAAEAYLLTGERDLHAAARELATWGPQEVLLTHSGGALILAAGVYHEAPFVARQIRGRSGRGDTCTAAYLSRRLSTGPDEAIAWAAATTSLKLEAEGPFRGDASQIEALYRRLHTGTASSSQPAGQNSR